MWISNWNAQISTYWLNVNSHFNVGLFNVCIALMTLHFFCLNDNTSSAVNICFSVTLISIISFSLIRTAYFSMMNVCSSSSKVLCILRITQWVFMKSTCLTNASFCSSSYWWIEIDKYVTVMINCSSWLQSQTWWICFINSVTVMTDVSDVILLIFVIMLIVAVCRDLFVCKDLNYLFSLCVFYLVSLILLDSITIFNSYHLSAFNKKHL